MRKYLIKSALFMSIISWPTEKKKKIDIIILVKISGSDRHKKEIHAYLLQPTTAYYHDRLINMMQSEQSTANIDLCHLTHRGSV